MSKGAYWYLPHSLVNAVVKAGKKGSIDKVGSGAILQKLKLWIKSDLGSYSKVLKEKYTLKPPTKTQVQRALYLRHDAGILIKEEDQESRDFFDLLCYFGKQLSWEDFLKEIHLTEDDIIKENNKERTLRLKASNSSSPYDLLRGHDIEPLEVKINTKRRGLQVIKPIDLDRQFVEDPILDEEVKQRIIAFLNKYLKEYENRILELQQEYKKLDIVQLAKHSLLIEKIMSLPEIKELEQDMKPPLYNPNHEDYNDWLIIQKDPITGANLFFNRKLKIIEDADYYLKDVYLKQMQEKCQFLDKLISDLK